MFRPQISVLEALSFEGTTDLKITKSSYNRAFDLKFLFFNALCNDYQCCMQVNHFSSIG